MSALEYENLPWLASVEAHFIEFSAVSMPKLFVLFRMVM